MAIPLPGYEYLTKWFGLVRHKEVMAHKECSMGPEVKALQRFGGVITPHILGRTVDNPKIALLHVVIDKKETNVEVTSTFARTGLAFLLKDDGRLVVLVHSILLHLDALSLKK